MKYTHLFVGPLRPESPRPCLAVKLEKGEGRASEPDPDPNSNPSSGSESESSVRPRRDVAAGSIVGLVGLAAGPSNFLPPTGPPRLRSVTKETEVPDCRDGEGNTAAAATRAADATREIMSPPPPESVPGSASVSVSSSFFDFDDFRLGRVGDHGLRTLSFRLGST